MQKTVPTPGRLLIMVGFALSCFGLLLFLWLAFGGAVPLKPKGYRFDISFVDATQLAQEADVRISGVPVGKVKAIETTDEGRSTATIELDAEYAPIPRDSRAMLRQKTLLGETYVELTPGTRNGPSVPENGLLPITEVSEMVELDEIVRAFDAPTRQAFRTWMDSQAQAVTGRSKDISDALATLDPFAEDTRKLLQILDSQEGAVRSLISSTGEVFGALSERRGELGGLIESSNRVFATTAERREDLQDLFRVLPTFSRESRATVERLETFARNTDPLVTQLRPAARELSPTLQSLERIAPDLRALFRDLDPLIRASRTGLPAFEAFLRDLRPFLGDLDPVLKQLQPIASFLREYRVELASFFANVPAATQARTPDGVHYLRTMNPLNPENLAVYPRRVGSNRTNPYMKPRGYDRLPRGLESFETRHCSNGVPTLATGALDALRALTPDVPSLVENISRFAFSAGEDGAVPAPPCVLQEPYRLREGAFDPNAPATQYPQVREAASSTGR
jgi:phospholipid/cholesterol/gamma-HCH transport system substrate-binding protein